MIICVFCLHFIPVRKLHQNSSPERLVQGYCYERYSCFKRSVEEYLGAQIPEISLPFTALNSYSYDEDRHSPGTRHYLSYRVSTTTEKLQIRKVEEFLIKS